MIPLSSHESLFEGGGLIYEIVNNANGKKYIGQTLALSFRICQHRAELRRGAHANDNLQRDFNKYGIDCFVVGVLDYLKGNGDMSKAERFYIDKFKDIVYNINILRSDAVYRFDELLANDSMIVCDYVYKDVKYVLKDAKEWAIKNGISPTFDIKNVDGKMEISKRQASYTFTG